MKIARGMPIRALAVCSIVCSPRTGVRAMLDVLATRLDAIVEICERHGVRSLPVFGSATTGDFDPTNADVDLLVETRSDTGWMRDGIAGSKVSRPGSTA